MADYLFVVTYEGGDASHAGDAIWLDLSDGSAGAWWALVENQAAAEAIAKNCGAKLVCAEFWDGSCFGDDHIGEVFQVGKDGIMGPSLLTAAPKKWRLIKRDELELEAARIIACWSDDIDNVLEILQQMRLDEDELVELTRDPAKHWKVAFGGDGALLWKASQQENS